MMTEEELNNLLEFHPLPWCDDIFACNWYVADANGKPVDPDTILYYIRYLEATIKETANLQKMIDGLDTPVTTLPPFPASVFEPVLNEDALKAAMDYAGRCYREIVSAAEGYKNITPTEKRIEEKGRES